MIEIQDGFKRGFAYGDDSKNQLDEIKSLIYKIEKVEIVQNVRIWAFEVLEFECMKKNQDLLDISQIKCAHGNSYEYQTVNRLPQEGWQELIDCWSCHDHEFKSMLDIKINPREKGILISNFYLIGHADALPKCCSKNTKVFYNEIACSFSNKFIIYNFFEEYFDMKNSVVLLIGATKYEIKLFYPCSLINDCDKNKRRNSLAFKVGFKESNKQNDKDDFIGDFFKQQILDQLNENSIGLNLLGFKLTFITLD
jgi:hypothetical protein